MGDPCVRPGPRCDRRSSRADSGCPLPCAWPGAGRRWALDGRRPDPAGAPCPSEERGGRYRLPWPRSSPPGPRAPSPFGCFGGLGSKSLEASATTCKHDPLSHGAFSPAAGRPYARPTAVRSSPHRHGVAARRLLPPPRVRAWTAAAVWSPARTTTPQLFRLPRAPAMPCARARRRAVIVPPPPRVEGVLGGGLDASGCGARVVSVSAALPVAAAVSGGTARWVSVGDVGVDPRELHVPGKGFLSVVVRAPTTTCEDARSRNAEEGPWEGPVGVFKRIPGAQTRRRRRRRRRRLAAVRRRWGGVGACRTTSASLGLCLWKRMFRRVGRDSAG